MYYIKLNKFTTVPLYRQLYEAFSAAIDHGYLTYNDLCPTEEMISMTFNISRPVVRQAYQLLIDDQKIVRLKGKGTFVAPRPKQSGILEHFHHYVGKLNPTITTHVLSMEKVDPPMEALRFAFDQETAFYHIKRLHRQKGHPLILEDVYLPATRFAQPETTQAEWSLMALADPFHPTHLDQEVMIAPADDSTALLMDVKSKSPVYKTLSVILSDKTPLMLVKALFNAQDHRLEVTLP
jgi:GntR family transcriptional regulator